MPATAVLGMQWGDEGKGKITHLLAADAQLVVRHNGGANAGHSIVHEGTRYGTHLLPAGAFYRGTRCVLAAGMVIDLAVLAEEARQVGEALGWEPPVLLAENAHLVLPYHRIIEGLEGSADRLGTTRRGIGPAYRDKASRIGVRVADLRSEELLVERLYIGLTAARSSFPEAQELAALSAETMASGLLSLARPYLGSIVDAGLEIEKALTRGEHVLFEGGQGALLDIDFGTYPYVTSSSTTLAGLAAATGIPTSVVEHRIGVAKAYVTRVGAGPFPTEIDDEERANAVRERGQEFGVTTGRPRRCGWLDLPALRHAARLNRPTQLAITKLDVLSGEEELFVCTDYELDGRRIGRFPLDAAELARCRPVYESLPGWDEPLSAVTSAEALPRSARAVIAAMEDAAAAPAAIISLGPAPQETLRMGF
ncbi:MAG: adenylosuccinate synthase [Candidatus Bipolaricaulota bacterium]|nr:MAG: adenylosuccinate synthase [Candidatus Bipolaricaulota bacterium]